MCCRFCVVGNVQVSNTRRPLGRDARGWGWIWGSRAAGVGRELEREMKAYQHAQGTVSRTPHLTHGHFCCDKIARRQE